MPTAFQMEVDAALGEGLPYYQARQRATDYYRRYTAREVTQIPLWWSERPGGMAGVDADHVLDWYQSDATPDLDLVCAGSTGSALVTPEDTASFNLFFSRIAGYAQAYEQRKSDPIGVCYLAYLTDVHNLQHVLRDDLQALMLSASNGRSLRTRGDLAELMGYTLREKSKTPAVFDRRLGCFQAGLRTYVQRLV